MKKHLNKIINLTAFVLVMTPVSALAAGLVPCDGVTVACGFSQLVDLVQNVLKYILYMVAPLSAIMFAYAGFLYMFSQGGEANKTKAKNIFLYVGIGLVFVLGAWLIVKLILVGLGAEGTSYLNL